MGKHGCALLIDDWKVVQLHIKWVLKGYILFKVSLLQLNYTFKY